MLLTTVLTIKPMYLSACLPFITSSHPFFSFLPPSLTHSLSFFLFFHPIPFILLFMTTPIVKNVDNACRIYVMYNLMALNDWLSRITRIPMIPIPFCGDVRSCVCVLWLLQLDSKWLFAICICYILESLSFLLYGFLEMTLISFRFEHAYVALPDFHSFVYLMLKKE